jgi:acetyltransferase-like isoleucine patch superfamily enzyme
MPEATSSHIDLQESKKPSHQKYKGFTVGEKKFLFLLKYEIITSLFGNFPGALGFFLRRIFFSRLIKKAGKGIIWGKGITLRHPHKIEIGDGVAINDLTVLDAYGDMASSIKIGHRSLISRNTIISSKGGSIEIGERTNIGTICIIFSRDCHVKLGNDVLMSAYCYLMGGGDHSMERTDIPIAYQGADCRGIEIGDGVWFGAGVKVRDGVKIGRDSVIGTNSFVNTDIPPLSIAAGIPAKIVKKREPQKNDS